jgi:hypothetical protein
MKPVNVSPDGAILRYLVFVCTVFGAVSFGAFELMQPSRLPNPGMAAYNAPPGTRLVPKIDLEKMNAPMYTALAPELPDPPEAAVAAEPKEHIVKPPKPPRKVAHREREHQPNRAAYAQQWPWGGGWNRKGDWDRVQTRGGERRQARSENWGWGGGNWSRF